MDFRNSLILAELSGFYFVILLARPLFANVFETFYCFPSTRTQESEADGSRRKRAMKIRVPQGIAPDATAVDCHFQVISVILDRQLFSFAFCIAGLLCRVLAVFLLIGRP